jgi:hypothetical protein
MSDGLDETRTMTIDDQRGAAFHEAGHAVAAWSIGLLVRRIAIGIDGDDAKGTAEIEQKDSTALVDQIAMWVAGGIAQEIFATRPMPAPASATWPEFMP